MKTTIRLAVVLALAGPVLGGSASEREEAATPAPTVSDPAAVPAAVPEWSGRPSDNICGLSDFRMLSNPAVVQFDQVVAATPEMEKLRREGIDPDSAKGIQLRSSAQKRAAQACEQVQRARQHCSVWRRIRHSGGKQAPDVTAHVLAIV